MQNFLIFNARMLVSFILLFNGFAHAEMPFTWIKHLYVVTGKNHQFSPVNGLVWYRQNMVKNMYDIWKKEPEDTKDNTIKLIEEMFYLQRDGVSFLPTKLPLKPAAYFIQSDIGRIIAAIQPYRAQDSYDKKAHDELVKKIGTIIKKSIQVQQQALETQLQKMQRQKDYPILSRSIEELDKLYNGTMKIGSISNEVKAYLKQKHKDFDISKAKSKSKELDEFLTKLKYEKEEEEKNPALTQFLALLQGKEEVKKLKDMNKQLEQVREQVENFSSKALEKAKITRSTKAYLEKEFPKKINFDLIQADDSELAEILTTLKDREQKQDKIIVAREILLNDLNEKNAPFRRLFNEIEHKVQMAKKASDEKSLKDLAELIVGSVEESSGKNKRYILYTTEQILLAFLWAKSDTREDFEAFFNALGQPYVDQQALSAWVKSKDEYTREDYNQFQNKLDLANAEMVVQLIGTAYEAAVFAVRAYQMWYQILPFVFEGTTVDYKKDENIYTFADCGETSLRNFFDIILKNLSEGKFDISYLQKAKSVDDKIPLKISVKLVGFYTKNFSFNDVTLQKIYNDWTHVVEDLSDVRYEEPKNDEKHFYEISAGLSNILQVFNCLLFDNSAVFKKLNKTEQLNLICKQLSRDEFTITWSATDLQEKPIDVEAYDYNLILYFKVMVQGQEIPFDWKFEKNHFVLSIQSTAYPIVKNKVDAIANYINICKPNDRISVYTLLGCYANRDNFESICSAAGKALSSDQLIQLIYCFYDVRADWGIVAQQLRDTNRASMILGIAKNASDDTALVNFFISKWLKEWIGRSSPAAQIAMVKELLTYNQVHAGSLSFILERFPEIIQTIDISKFPGIASFMQKLNVKDHKQKIILTNIIVQIIKKDIQKLFPIALSKANELDENDCINLIKAVSTLHPIGLERFIRGLIAITLSFKLLNFFIDSGKLNKNVELVSLAEKRKLELLGISSSVKEVEEYGDSVD